MGDAADQKTREQFEEELVEVRFERKVMGIAIDAAVEPIYEVAKELADYPARRRLLEEIAASMDGIALAVPEIGRRVAETPTALLDTDEDLIREALLARGYARRFKGPVLVAELVAARAANDARLKEIDDLPAEGDVGGPQSRGAWEIINEVQGNTVELQHKAFRWIIEGLVDPAAAAEAMVGNHSIDQELV
jgi:hypothetical protein